MTLRTRLLLPAAGILLAAMLAILLATTREIVQVIDHTETDLYRGKLTTVVNLLAQRERRLAATGMRTVYEESFRQSTLATLCSTYFQKDHSDFPFILAPDGHILLYPTGFPTLREIVTLTHRKDGETVLTTADGQRVWVAYTHFHPWQWTVGWAVPETSKYAPVKQLQQRIMMILAIAFVLVSGLLAYLVRRATRPVVELTAAAQAMAEGDLDSTIPTGGRDEVGVLAWALDTMRRRLREKIDQLSASEKNYRELVQSANAIVLHWDKEGRILFMNDYGLHLFGFSHSELVGRLMVGTIVPEHDSRGADLGRMIDDIIRQPDRYRMNENENITKDGRRLIIQWSNRAITDEDGNVVGLLSIGADITERKRLEAELRQAQKLEAIGTLAGGIAHDFNNILTAIFGFTELAQMEAKDNPNLRKRLDQLLTAATRARDLVRQILTFSRRSEHQKMPLQISLLIKESLKLLRASLPATIDIRTNIASDEQTLADPTQIHQMIMNLATNAFHAMEEKGGVLGISLTATTIDAATAHAINTDLAPGRYLRLEVSDTGCGMDPATMEKIFEPYFTTKEQGKGTGLGLAVVHGIVKSHGGAIQVTSQPGFGSVFTILLPIAPVETSDPAAAAPAATLPHQTGTARIMVVDDEETIRFLAEEFLTRAGHRVTSFATPTAALQEFSRQPARWDLVVTDLTMPEGTGLDLAARLRVIRPELPVILCSGYNEVVGEEQLAAAGIAHCLRKPLLQKELLDAVVKVLGEGHA